MSQASVECNKRMDSITLRPDRARGERIRRAAAEEGCGLQSYILKAVEFWTKSKGMYKVAYPKEQIDRLAKQCGMTAAEYLKSLHPPDREDLG